MFWALSAMTLIAVPQMNIVKPYKQRRQKTDRLPKRKMRLMRLESGSGWDRGFIENGFLVRFASWGTGKTLFDLFDFDRNLGLEFPFLR